MSDASGRTSHIIQLLSLLVAVAALALAVTVPEVRGLLGLDESDHPAEARRESRRPADDAGNDFPTVDVDPATVAAPAPVSAVP